MLNLSCVVRSRQKFRVQLKRKPTGNAVQDARTKVIEVSAADWREAQQIALADPANAAFQINGQPKEIR